MEPQKKALAKIKLQQVLYEIEFSPPVNVQFSAHVPYDSPTQAIPLPNISPSNRNRVRYLATCRYSVHVESPP